MNCSYGMCYCNEGYSSIDGHTCVLSGKCFYESVETRNAIKLHCLFYIGLSNHKLKKGLSLSTNILNDPWVSCFLKVATKGHAILLNIFLKES